MTAAASPTGTDRDDADGDEPLGPSGWHADPWRRHVLRFYDGRLWTEHVSDGGVAGLDSTPVAAAERSRPRPEQAAPPDDPVGARVLPGDGPVAAADPVRLAVEPLVLVGAPDDAGVRILRMPDDRAAGRIEPRRRSLVARLGWVLVTDPSSRVTRLRVLDVAGNEVVRLDRPWRRTAAVVDVIGPGGPLGTIVADRVVQGLRARVVAADGRELGLVDQADTATGALVVVGEDGARLARLTPVWDVPGRRHHLPPGVLLLDRRPPPGQSADPATSSLFLAALLAPTLLQPPR